MHATTQEAGIASALDYKWWRGMQADSTQGGSLDVATTSVFDVTWCAVRHVSLGRQPHRVQFRRDSHTLMIFDRASFVEGERWVDGYRLTASGALDVGLDIVPAGSDFRAWAGPGSNVACTLISIAPDSVPQTLDGAQQSTLRTSIGLENDLLLPLIARLRQIGRPDSLAKHDCLYLESLCMVLFREVMFAQEQAHTARPARPGGGLSPRAQRLIIEFLHHNMDQKVELQELADLVGVSRFHFTRAFKVSFGSPPYQYLLNMRLRKAADLLRGTRDPITDIALRAGFSCSSEFARAFKQAMSCSPREFRQMNH